MKRPEILEVLGITASTFRFYENRGDIVALSGTAFNREYDIEQVKAIIDKWNIEIVSTNVKRTLDENNAMIKKMKEDAISDEIAIRKGFLVKN